MKKDSKWSSILKYPYYFNKVPESECNGVGPKNFGNLVDDYIFDVNIRESAIIHDACWYIKMDQRKADKLFLENMMIQIRYEPKFSKRARARIAAYWYYSLVRFGGSFFYD
jgi:hypothetical protein